MPYKFPRHLVPHAEVEGSRGTISLRHQLAREGCAESQFAVAKRLLGEVGVSRNDRHINACLAVNWLLRASSKGHTPSLRLLKQCSETGIGVNADNYFDIEKLLNLSKDQILARKVAHCITSTIMSDTEDLITEEVFQERAEAFITQNEAETDVYYNDNDMTSQPQEVEEIAEPSTTVSGPCVSLSDVVSSVQQCLEGKLPLVTLKRVAQYEEYNKWCSTKYFHKLSAMLRSALIILVRDLGLPNLPLTLLLCSIFMSVYFCGFTVNHVASVIEEKVALCAVISLVVMMSCSCYVVHLNIGFCEVTQWLDLIRLFHSKVKTEVVQQKYLKQSLLPFSIFFITSLVFNILYPNMTISLMSRELYLFSIVISILLDRTITGQRYYVNLSLIFNLIFCLSKGNLLTISSIGWFSYLNYELCFSISDKYEVHLNLWSIFALLFVLPYLYVKMGFSNGKNGWYLVLFPHLLCLTWMNLACNFYFAIEPGFVFYSSCFWFAVLLFTKRIGAIPSLMIFSLIKTLYVLGTWPSITTLITVFLFMVLFFICSFVISKLKLLFKTTVITALLLAVFISVMFIKVPSSSEQMASEAALPWQKYETYCHRRAWYQSNTADVEISCLPLKGKQISVEGTITEINLVAVTNRIKFLVEMFPSPISDWLTCAVGEDLCSKDGLSPLEKERCAVFNSLNVSGCSLHNWNTYDYRIIVEVSSRTSPEIIVRVGHLCTSFVRALKEGDSLQIVGQLYDSIGGNTPEIVLEYATCDTCSELKCPVLQKANDFTFDYRLSLRHIVKFYFTSFIQPKMGQ